MIIDIIVALVIAYGFYIGYSRGLIKTIFASASLLIGIVAAIKLSPILIGVIDNVLNLNPAVNFIIGFVLTFIIVLALIRFLGNKLTDLLEKININFINQIAGGAFMSLFFAILMSYGMYFLSNLKLLSEEQKTASITYTLLEPLPQKTQSVFKGLRPVFNEFWDKMVETMDQINEKSKELEKDRIDPNENPMEQNDQEMKEG